MAGINLQLEPEALEPLLQRIVEATVVRLEQERAKLSGKFCYSEPEAAALLGKTQATDK